jgi:hypothetical protein
MQSTTSLFRTSLRRTALPLVRARLYSVGTGSTDAQAQASSSGSPSSEASSSVQQAAGDVSASSSSTSSSGPNSEPSTSSSTSTSTSTQSRTRSQNRAPKIPSTSSTAEYVRENGIPGFLPRESFENVEKWVGGHWERLEAEMQCESSRVIADSGGSRLTSMIPLPTVSPFPLSTILSQSRQRY